MPSVHVLASPRRAAAPPRTRSGWKGPCRLSGRSLGGRGAIRAGGQSAAEDNPRSRAISGGGQSAAEGNQRRRAISGGGQSAAEGNQRRRAISGGGQSA